MRQRKAILVTIIVWTMLLSSTGLQAEVLRISAAASMRDLITELIRDFARQHPGIRVLPNFGPSGGLAKQISQGAPVDIYIAANPKWMAFLVESENVDGSTVKTFAYNQLVFIGRKDSAIGRLEDLSQLQRIGIGSPKSVPAGQYAKQALMNVGIYDQLLQAGKLVMAKDVRQALIYADRSETEGSFVYKTDAQLATTATILFEVPPELHDTITYPLAITSVGADKEAAVTFYNFMGSEEALRAMRKYGFFIPE